MDRVYLDHNATSPLRPLAREAMLAALAETGNASSVHREGQAARARVEHARAQVAALVGVDPRAVFFTSGATEAIAAALSPELEVSARAVACDVLLISAIEHPAVRAGGRFSADKTETIPVDGSGVVNLAALEMMLTEHKNARRKPFVSAMAANNETGVVQPLGEIAQLVHAAEGVFHVDAVQIVGRYPFDLETSGADLISISSHKLGGPQGAGAMIARDADTRIPPLLRGGGQERGTRAGTENVAAIAGFGAASEEAATALAEEASRLASLREQMENGIRTILPSAVVFSEAALRVPNTTCFAVPTMSAETALIAFDLASVAVSSGSACSSGKVAASETLKAMNVDSELAKCAIRVSTGWSTTKADIARFLEVFARVYAPVIQTSRTKAA
ncbi:MAG TPA: cysteine desulfurase family protein [Xanthobacteraceae bacterium]|nr:cysteine desulfurase family protein [Xanthobacteraceae bacterium]